MLTILELVLLVLASIAIRRAWFKGSLFDETRAVLEQVDEENDDAGYQVPEPAEGEDDPSAVEAVPLGFLMTAVGVLTPRWLARLLLCPLCISYHIPWVAALLLVLPGYAVDLYLPEWKLLAIVVRIPLYAFAVAGIITTNPDEPFDE